MIQIRIEGGSAQEVQAVADTIESLFAQHIVFSEARAGSNPRYTGRQKYFSYGHLSTPTEPASDNPDFRI